MKLISRHLPNITQFLIFQIFIFFCVGDDKTTNSSEELYRIEFEGSYSHFQASCRQNVNNLTKGCVTKGAQNYGCCPTILQTIIKGKENHTETVCTWRWGKWTFNRVYLFESAKGNKNPVIGKNTFESEIKFRRINLSGNVIQTVESKAFGCKTELEILDLSDNYIESLPSDVFQCMECLKYLYLSGNRIGALPEGIFDILSSLRVLDLTFNLITQLPEGIFNNTTDLKELQLSSNRLHSFSANIAHLGRLEILDVSRNCLKGTLSLRVPDSLRNISVSRNKLTDIKWSDFRYVRIFLAENNEIQSLRIQDIPQTDIQYIHLEGNKIQRLFLDWNFSKFSYKIDDIHVYLLGNPFSCDCRAIADYEKLRLITVLLSLHFYDGLICQYPPKLKGRDLLYLHSDDFPCEVRESCPKICRCVESLDTGLITINCTRTGLTHLPFAVPRNANILLVDQNDLRSLASLNETRFENLTEIHARGNRISSEEFFLPRTLKLLLLDENRLTTLPESLRSHIQRTQGFKITLSGNMWSCDCSSLPLKSFLSTHTAVVTDAFQIRCIFKDNSTSNATLLEMEQDDFCPSNASSFPTVEVVLMILVATTMVLIKFYYHHKKLLLVLLYSRYRWLYRLFCCHRLAEERKSFDCFLSYGSEDRDVVFAILRELEERSIPPFTFCLHERNWKAGANICDNIFLSVERCTKTLIVLSRTFSKNVWFHLEFQAAWTQTLKDRRDRILVVLKGDMPDRRDLPRDVRHLLATRTYLVWGEWWFFEKLKNSLQEDTVSLKEWLQDFFRSVANILRGGRRYIQQGERVV